QTSIESNIGQQSLGSMSAFGIKDIGLRDDYSPPAAYHARVRGGSPSSNRAQIVELHLDGGEFRVRLGRTRYSKRHSGIDQTGDRAAMHDSRELQQLSSDLDRYPRVPGLNHFKLEPEVFGKMVDLEPFSNHLLSLVSHRHLFAVLLLRLVAAVLLVDGGLLLDG